MVKQSKEYRKFLKFLAAQQDQADKDFLIVALDLLSELTEALRDYIEPLLEQSNLNQLVYFCSQVFFVIV